ncbi:MAG: hypothetical protein RIG26_09950 [Thalassospira sp.]|uniref:hypothetical protein n=1 Tax=Thalassospira sp. TaxID=1912094 RepID=UPI0032EB273C
MMRDENGQEDHQPVYLPENRHHWASNDEVGKPAVDLTRGPVHMRFKRKTKTGPALSAGEWMRENLPQIGSTAIVVIVVLCVVVALYTDLAGIVLR